MEFQINNDLISRSALKEDLFIKFGNQLPNGLLNEIDNAPTVKERPQGEWVIEKLQHGFEDVYCPYCKARPTRSAYGYYLKDNFCHECGADMRRGGAE